MVEGGLPGQTGAIFHFRPYPRISGEGKGLNIYKVQLKFDIIIQRRTAHMGVPTGIYEAYLS